MISKEALEKEEPAIYTLILAARAHPARARLQFVQQVRYALNPLTSVPPGGPPCP